MRLGFVGVGKHSQRMARAFRECGAETVAYDRAARPVLYNNDGFGMWVPWRDMITSPDIDAIVCCAPPLVTAEVTLLCAEVDKNVCATKPFLWAELPATLKLDMSERWQQTGKMCRKEYHNKWIYVDLWRLYSPAWRALKSELAGREIKSVHVDFYGNGPVRMTHSGLLDYGPHALALLLDLGLKPELKIATSRTSRALWSASDGVSSICVGNGADRPVMSVFVRTTDGGEYTWTESGHLHTFEAGGSQLMQHWRDLALREFCRSFLRGNPSDTLRISCEAMRLLAQSGPDGRLVTQ